MLHVSGMHGLGDNLHERAIVRALMLRGSVQLETPWPSVFHDLVGPRLRLTSKGSSLRTQRKNVARETSRFVPARSSGSVLKVWYTPDEVRRCGSFLAAMAANCGVTVAPHDFSLSIPAEWHARAARWIDRWAPTRPLMIYRPLVERTEWPGCASRNPDHAAYAELLRGIRDRFFVVSVADLERGKEWSVGTDIQADAECHAGELEFETLAALTARAGLVYCSPGFALVLAQAVGTPLAAVFGGHEAARFYDHGDPRHHFVQPIIPCECFDKRHACQKQIDLPRAQRQLGEFIDGLTARPAESIASVPDADPSEAGVPAGVSASVFQSRGAGRAGAPGGERQSELGD